MLDYTFSQRGETIRLKSDQAHLPLFNGATGARLGLRHQKGTEMLKGINPNLNADVLYALRAMGHGDDLIIADTNFPSDSIARETVLGQVLRIDLPAAEVAKAVLSVYPIDTFVDDAIARMEVVGEPDTLMPVMKDVQAEVSAAGGGTMISVERFAFYERAKNAYAVIQTGERRFYGCFAIRKGVVPPDEA
ncbi:RbsD/FucU family protein [Rhodobacteraceae bacterium]|nr:RbsD/FucU family protein [Paracoccaceae bacterium]